MISGQGNQSTGQNDRLVKLATAVTDGFRSLSLAASAGTIDDVEGAVCWYSSSQVPVFNGAGLFSETLLNKQTLDAIRAYFEAKQRPFSLVTLDALTPDAPRQLASLGFEDYDLLPAMWLDNPQGDAGQSEDIVISRVGDAEGLAQFRSILREVFIIPPADINLIMGNRALGISHVRHYLAHRDGKPVGTATLVFSPSVAGVWNVGTLPTHRRRGVASALMHHLLDEAKREGYTSSMLLSSNEGMSMYLRLGFKTATNVRVFVPDRQIELRTTKPR